MTHHVEMDGQFQEFYPLGREQYDDSRFHRERNRRVLKQIPDVCLRQVDADLFPATLHCSLPDLPGDFNFLKALNPTDHDVLQYMNYQSNHSHFWVLRPDLKQENKEILDIQCLANLENAFRTLYSDLTDGSRENMIAGLLTLPGKFSVKIYLAGPMFVYSENDVDIFAIKSVLRGHRRAVVNENIVSLNQVDWSKVSGERSNTYNLAYSHDTLRQIAMLMDLNTLGTKDVLAARIIRNR